MATTEKKVYVIHENEEWVVPLREAFNKLGTSFEEWFLDEGIIPINDTPPAGVFYNRMSASSHTRDHRWGPEYTSNVLAWLQRHDRPMANGPDAIRLEVSKVAQYAALEKAGVRVPKTFAAIGKNQIMEAAQHFKGQPFITKHNRAGKGLGVQLFRSLEALQQYVDSPGFEEPIDGITLLQEYIQSPAPYITRVEFVGQEFMYAVKIDTSQGFELCPADSCQVGDNFCPANQEEEEQYKFTILENFGQQEDEKALIEKYIQVMKAHDIEVAGIEFIKDAEGNTYTYDINTNTNYNRAAEKRAGREKGGMDFIAEFLTKKLAA